MDTILRLTNFFPRKSLARAELFQGKSPAKGSLFPRVSDILRLHSSSRLNCIGTPHCAQDDKHRPGP